MLYPLSYLTCPPPPSLIKLDEENQKLHEENASLKAQTSDKDKVIAQLQAEIAGLKQVVPPAAVTQPV